MSNGFGPFVRSLVVLDRLTVAEAVRRISIRRRGDPRPEFIETVFDHLKERREGRQPALRKPIHRHRVDRAAGHFSIERARKLIRVMKGLNDAAIVA
jgi:hypothetical protein